MTQQAISYSAWIGKQERREDEITAAPLALLAATLDRDEPEPGPGTPLPPGGHWLFFLERVRLGTVGADGHGQRGDFLPPIDLPRRMFGGARMTFHHPLAVGDRVTRTRTISSITPKSGRTGRLVFMGLREEFANPRGVALTIDTDIAFREESPPSSRRLSAEEMQAGAPKPPARPEWRRNVQAGPVMLFRFSALTFNSHRIHYDRPYAMEAEGYPGLVVTGPLIATLLLDLVRRQRPNTPLKTFAFRAHSPLFDMQTFSLNGAPVADGSGRWHIWAENPQGGVAMMAEAEW